MLVLTIGESDGLVYTLLVTELILRFMASQLVLVPNILEKEQYIERDILLIAVCFLSAPKALTGKVTTITRKEIVIPANMAL